MCIPYGFRLCLLQLLVSLPVAFDYVPLTMQTECYLHDDMVRAFIEGVVAESNEANFKLFVAWAPSRVAESGSSAQDLLNFSARF